MKTKMLCYRTLFGEHDTVAEWIAIEEGSGDAAAAVPAPSTVVPAPSAVLRALGSADALQQAGDSVQVEHEKTDTIPSVKEERDTTTLKWKTEPRTTTAAVPSKTRGRTRWFIAATWKGAKCLLLCGCCSRA